MHRRAPLVLTLLAVGAVCLLLWEAVIAPALSETGATEESSMLPEGDLLSAEDGTASGGPTLSTKGRPGMTGTGPDGMAGVDPGANPEDAAALRAKAAGVSFEGRVVGPRGAPVEGATIVLKNADGLLETIQTGANGRFKHSMRPGRYALMFDSDEGGLILRSWTLDGAPREDLEFALKEPGAIRVKLHRGADPLAGAEVTVTSREVGDLATYQNLSGADGEIVFEGLIPGRYEVTALVPDGPLGKHNTYASPGHTRDVQMRVPEGVVLKGVVRAGANGPGVQAAVTLESSAAKSHGRFVTTFDTNPDGTYEVQVPRGHPRVFLVEAEGYAPWPELRQNRNVLRSMRNLARKGPVTRNVTLKEGAALRGTVLDEQKTPIPGVDLRFVVRRGPTVTATTKADGTYVVANVNPGTYELQIGTPSYFPVQGQALRVAIPGGTSPKPVEFDITLAGARRLTGVVVDGAGVGMAGARVWITGGGRVVRSARNAGRELEVFTNEAGGWAITDIPPDKNVVVRAAMGDLEADPVSAPWERPPPQPIRMTLQGTADLRGIVRDLATRAPLARVRVRITPDPYNGRSGRTVYTNGKGEFAALRMLPGRWKLLPQLSGYLPAEPDGIDLVREGEHTADLRLDPGEVFAGVVQDERGTPLRYARIRVRGRPFDAERDVTRAVNTDAKGQFRLTGFRQGAYEVRASRQGFRTQVVRDMRRGDDAMRFLLKKR